MGETAMENTDNKINSEDSSKNEPEIPVNVRGKVADHIAHGLGRSLSENASEQQQKDEKAIRDLRGKFVEGFTSEDDVTSKVKIPLRESEMRLLNQVMPQPGMGDKLASHVEMMGEIQGNFQTAKQNEKLKTGASWVIERIKLMFQKILFK